MTDQIAPQETRLAITPMEMLEKAVSSGADVTVMERLMDMHDRWYANQARVAFSGAITAMRKDMPAIIKSKEVNFGSGQSKTHYKYEDLADMVDALSEPLATHKLSFRWRTDSTVAGSVSVTCILEHEAGHFEETTLCGPYDTSGNKNAIQAIGSIVTYLQRYTLKAALGIAAGQDDDGRQGAGSGEAARRQQAPPPWMAGFAEWRKVLGNCRYLSVLVDQEVPEGGEAAISANQAKTVNAALKKEHELGEVEEIMTPDPKPKAVEQPPEPQQPPQEAADSVAADQPTLDTYRSLCSGYKAYLGEEDYHKVLGGKSNEVPQDEWPGALVDLHQVCTNTAPDNAPFPAVEYFAEAQGMNKPDVLEGIQVFAQTQDEDEKAELLAMRDAYLGGPTEKALVAPLRVFHAALCQRAWERSQKAKGDAADLFGTE